MDEQNIKEAIQILERFDEEYWNSEIDGINLIEDLRLSQNIHETAHSRILYKLLCLKKQKLYPLLKTFLNVVGISNVEINVNTHLYVEKDNIDLLIVADNWNVILENKVNHAKDQERQIQRYYESVKGKNDSKDIYVLYLTRSQYDAGPSEDSFPPSLREKLGAKYKKISYEKEIPKWLDKYKCQQQKIGCLNNCALIQYADYIKNMFNPNEKKLETMNEILDEILNHSNSKNIEEKYQKIKKMEESLDIIKENIPQYIVGIVKKEFEEKIPYRIDRYDSCKIKFCVDYNKQQYIGVANVVEGYDGGLWFGLKQNHKEIYLWEEKENETKHVLFPKEKFIKAINEYGKKRYIIEENKSNGSPDKYDVFYVGQDNDYYAYWKYSESITSMIDDIKEYIDIIGNITDDSSGTK